VRLPVPAGQDNETTDGISFKPIALSQRTELAGLPNGISGTSEKTWFDIF
jgi:hypothetical protein